MSYPAGWDLVNVTGTYIGKNGVPCVGSVTFSSPQLVLRSGTIVPAADIVFTLVNGAFTGQIPATDDPNASPTGWVYTVTENVPGGRQGYQIVAPNASPGIDLSTVVPVTMPMPPTFGFPYVTLAQLSGTSVGNGAYLIGYQSPLSGSVARTLQSKEQDVVSVLDFMTTAQIADVRAGTLTQDVTAAIQAACNSGASEIKFPAGAYLISSTITPAANQALVGVSYKWDSTSTYIKAAAGMNAPLFKFTSSGTLSGLTIHGTAGAGTPSQALVYINNTNSVVLRSVFFNGGYDLVLVDGTSFYTDIVDCVFYSAYRSQLYCNSATSSGCDLIVRGCRFLAVGAITPSYCAYFNGLGSLIMSDCQFSVDNPSGAALFLDQPATAFGGAQFVGCVFECGNATAPAVYVKGSGPTPWTYMQFVNCLMTASGGPALRADYCNRLSVNGCVLSSPGATGSYFIPASGTVSDFVFVDVDFEGNAGNAPAQCGTPVSLSGSFVSCRWLGSAPMVDYSNAASGNVGYLDVYGRALGSNATPIKLNTELSVPGTRMIDTAWSTYTPSVGATSGSITTSSATGYYKRVGTVMHVLISVTITTNGTGAGGVTCSLPIASVNSPVTLSGREVGVSGKTVMGYVGAGGATLGVYFYDNTYPGANSANIVISGSYQTG